MPKATVKTNSGLAAVETNGAMIPPPDAPVVLSKYARFAATEATLASTRETTHVCTWGTPPKNSFIRTHPNPAFRVNLHVLTHEVGNKKKAYLLDPILLSDPDLEGLTKIVQLVPFVTHHRPPKLGLWPIAIEHENNPWIKGALNISVQAKSRWLKVVPVTARGEYITREPPLTFHEPEWDRTPPTIDGWIDLAVQETDWLTPENWEEHAIRKAIREGS
jgi:hypothetical protein